MYRTVLALSALMISACSTDNHHEQSMHHNDFELSDSAVKIQIKSGNMTISGSGTWIDEQHILTASHLWLDASKDYSLSIITRHGSQQATVINIDNPQNRDLALLKVEKIVLLKPHLIGGFQYVKNRLLQVSLFGFYLACIILFQIRMPLPTLPTIIKASWVLMV
ncbi:trypsin-like serine protease [Salmonella enterica]|uniref:trypsin-like serine protease n=1 Tax=Salmonella enterica TaxID=28901 RepID=UPI0003590407|nr:trypsin-like serine protease [Salmonella enterica]AGQ76111.1 hypothetical protein CFSAN002050_00870 [Salmonella enterica subsp. enterica serovar Cubana str. CFSAN002050]